MKNIKIRTKMMLWFMLFSAALLCVLVPTVYTSVAVSLRETQRADLQMLISQVFTSAEQQNGTLSLDFEELDIPDNCHLVILSAEGDIVYSTGNSGWLISQKPINGENTINANGKIWAVQAQNYEINESKMTVIAASSMEYVENSLHNLILLLLILIPLYLCASAFGAFFIAKRALRPIRVITQTAKVIGKGGLSSRLDGNFAKDEVGELARTFNQMLNTLENSFRRERQFTSDASHELRTPISIISACAEDALSDIGKGGREDIETIRAEAARMTSMLSQLLMLSRGYEGCCRFETDELILYDIVESVAEELKTCALEENISIHNGIPRELEIKADQSLMTQLFVNLIGNAVKYGKKRGNVWLRAENRSGMVRIEAEDDGIGISEEDLPHIFERFYRADKARDRSGSGLGLAIAKWIVELHGGTIEVKSCLERGSVFTIMLPDKTL